jgi:hypothetical protein
LEKKGSSKFKAKPLEDAIDDIVNRYDKVTLEAAKLKKPKTDDPAEPLLIDNNAKM